MEVPKYIEKELNLFIKYMRNADIAMGKVFKWLGTNGIDTSISDVNQNLNDLLTVNSVLRFNEPVGYTHELLRFIKEYEK